ncbi:hypothetical protein [Marinisporobacter balticus]|uniref:Uncharacterized protein n=1 Tax=Marinisporobacter balticus TaxID=2018667 RepID=A0A4V2SCL4_9FIRM|nr:hypothetical protein [Marinisporobacter balticus]TCO79830.1 hypothetical protein EV214_10161 [Marinisporobacter balticus]
MGKQFGIFIKILLILIIFSILLPRFIDHLINMYMIEEKNTRPRGNSTFVSSAYIETNKLKENFLESIKSFMK